MSTFFRGACRTSDPRSTPSRSLWPVEGKEARARGSPTHRASDRFNAARCSLAGRAVCSVPVLAFGQPGGVGDARLDRDPRVLRGRYALEGCRGTSTRSPPARSWSAARSSTPGATIAEALAMATVDDRINVASGSYDLDEPMALDRLQLRGAGMNKTVITRTTLWGGGVSIVADGVRLEDLTIGRPVGAKPRRACSCPSNRSTSWGAARPGAARPPAPTRSGYGWRAGARWRSAG